MKEIKQEVISQGQKQTFVVWLVVKRQGNSDTGRGEHTAGVSGVGAEEPVILGDQESNSGAARGLIDVIGV